ncbi:MAG TPA: transcription elongation factor [Opitutaceae bacterium]|jgi:transcription elongation GreA/GreB family factor
MDKSALIKSVIERLEAELARQAEAALSSRAEATDGESRQEGRYDMRSQSAAYLAEGQSRLAAELAAAIQAWKGVPSRAFGPGEGIALGALVTLEAAGKRAAYLVGPQAGGLEATDGAAAALVVTPGSPLGRQLLGRRAGDTVAVSDGRRAVAHAVASVE